ncbi:MAG: 2-oxoacid:ferredoxin oxidoreductase subunit beta [Anaerolineales bacterium]|nr:2-oxoacid:ferredoxin oxidoreductase subunit beta [Anaerolineales bacterium]
MLNALQNAFAALDLDRRNLVVVSGIGCSSDLPHFLNVYGIHTLHGRALPVAQGIKMANKELTVVVTGGDGDGYGIGAGHFLHAMRRNLDLTYIVMDNRIYGLTTGQASPTSYKGHKTKSTPAGNPECALNPLALAVAGGATFVGRGFSGEPIHLAETMKRAIAHKGFSLVDVLSPCVTWNKSFSYDYYRPLIVKLDQDRHDPSDRDAALRQALREDKLPIGVLYEIDEPTFAEEEPSLQGGPLVRSRIGLTDEEWAALMDEFS